MTLPRLNKGRGGFLKPISLGLFIQEQLAMGSRSGSVLYADYKAAAQAFPRARGGKRHIINYNGFMHYLYLARRLGLVDYETNPDGSILEEEAHDKGGNPAPQLAPSRFFRITGPGRSDSAWQNLWAALRDRRPPLFTSGIMPSPIAPTPPKPVAPIKPVPPKPTAKKKAKPVNEELIDRLLDLMNEDDKSKSIKALEKALAGLDYDQWTGLEEIEEAIAEYKEITRAGISPEEYTEAKETAFDFINETIEGIEEN